MNYEPGYVLNHIVFPCSRGTYLMSERPALEGVHAALCAKEISSLLKHKILTLGISKRRYFEKHNEGKNIVANWARKHYLDFEKEVDISIGVADVLVYADDVGIFEIGTTRPSKMILLLKYIARQNRPITAHFWPYGTRDAFIFKNWK